MTIDSIVSLVLTGFVILGGYVWRSTVIRIEKLENQMEHKMDKDEVRQILKDKLEPLSDDIQEVKNLVTKLLELELQRKK